jgi:hypothetical protein
MDNRDFGIIEDGLLLYKGIYYAISSVGKGVLFLNTNKLFGRCGDEFPLAYVKTRKHG